MKTGRTMRLPTASRRVFKIILTITAAYMTSTLMRSTIRQQYMADPVDSGNDILTLYSPEKGPRQKDSNILQYSSNLDPKIQQTSKPTEPPVRVTTPMPRGKNAWREIREAIGNPPPPSTPKPGIRAVKEYDVNMTDESWNLDSTAIPETETFMPDGIFSDDPRAMRFPHGPLVNDSQIKTILYWNSFFTSSVYRFGTGQRPFLENNCKVNTCQATNNRTWLDKADVVVFHGPWLEEFGPIPDHRPEGQLYVYVQNEPQVMIAKQVLPRYRGMFNVTITHRLNSDIHLPYGWVKKSKRSWLNKVREGVSVSPTDRPGHVIWMASHCETPSKREWYVAELRNHIPVDVYGTCGPRMCYNKSETCMANFERQYKFFLAFENDICKDYITEKLYRTLDYDIIPIVLGGGNYSLETPPHSVIDIMDYPNPKDLANYLRYLNSNETAYAEYFAWKTEYEVENFRRTVYAKAFCDLCDIIHDPTYVYRSSEYHAIDKWWLVDHMCDSNRISVFRQMYHW